MSLQFEKLASVDAFDELRTEWEQIEAELSPRSPFTSALWNGLWWQHLSRTGFAQDDEFFAHTVRENGRLIAVAPLMITVAPSIGPLRTRRLHYFGADPNITEIHGLVCRSEDMERVVAGLGDHLSSTQATAWDWLRWSGIVKDSAAHRLLDSQVRVKWDEPVLNYWLPLPATWEEFRAGRSRNIKESLRKCYNSLKREGHEYQLVVAADRQCARPALEQFFELHAARAAAEVAVRHPDYFAMQPARDFLHEYCDRMAERDLLRIFQLQIAGVVVATRVGFVLGRELYLYYSGYLPEWGKFSVMTTLLAEILKWSIAQGFSKVNLSVGNDNSKLRWDPEETVLCQGVQQGPGWRNRMSFRIYSWIEGI